MPAFQASGPSVGIGGISVMVRAFPASSWRSTHGDDELGDGSVGAVASDSEGVADSLSESGVADSDGSSCASAIAFSSAAIVAASTAPVGFTPSSVWKSLSASVSSGVHSPSTGPSQNPASFSVCCTAVVATTSSWAVAPPAAATSSSSAAAVALSTVPVTGSSWAFCRLSTASTVAGP